MTNKNLPSKTKKVVLTLDELADLLIISRAKAMKVNEKHLPNYIAQCKHEFTPLVNFIYEDQKINCVTYP